MNINEVKAIITGGGSGIGLEIAGQLKAQGAQVFITGRNEEKLKQAATSIGAFYAVANATDETAVI